MPYCPSTCPRSPADLCLLFTLRVDSHWSEVLGRAMRCLGFMRHLFGNRVTETSTDTHRHTRTPADRREVLPTDCDTTQCFNFVVTEEATACLSRKMELSSAGYRGDRFCVWVTGEEQSSKITCWPVLCPVLPAHWEFHAPSRSTHSYSRKTIPDEIISTATYCLKTISSLRTRSLALKCGKIPNCQTQSKTTQAKTHFFLAQFDLSG